MAEASIMLTLQQAMLEASQLASRDFQAEPVQQDVTERCPKPRPALRCRGFSCLAHGAGGFGSK
jgi:hypothetical protein